MTVTTACSLHLSRRLMKTVDVIYFNAGGGHRASALAIEAVVRQQNRPWRIRLVDLFQVLDAQDRFRRLTGAGPEAWYNKRLARGWTAGLAQELKVLQSLIRIAHPVLVRRLCQHWLQSPPDLVVSAVPNFNRVLYQSLASALPGVPFVTVLTDLADHPPNFWIERNQHQHFICGTRKAVEQARAMGHADERIHATSGMIIRPDFYQPRQVDRAHELSKLGLDPQRPTGLVLFGGHGSRAMLRIAKRLGDTQLILICGHNRTLADRLRALSRTAPRLVVEFSSEIPYYMQLADFFIGKLGPGSISEAVQQGLPVIVADNVWTMPQERYNAKWVSDNGLGIVHRSFRTIDRAVAELLGQLDEYRANVRTQDNRALFEIPQILAHVMEQTANPLTQEAA